MERGLVDTTFLVADDLSIEDIAVYAYSHRAEDCDLTLTDYPAVTAWLGRVREVLGPNYPVHPYSIDPLCCLRVLTQMHSRRRRVLSEVHLTSRLLFLTTIQS